METKDFIIELEKKDMKLWLNEEGGLAFKGPKNFMTDDLLNQIKERKEEIVECLKRERFIKHDEKGKYLQFPLNDMQSAYYSGMKRIYELGGTSCYTYLELEVPQIDVLKLEQAWHQVIAKHDMLRAIVSKDGMQQILEKVLLPRLDVYDEDSLEEVRSDMEKLNFDIEKGPNHNSKNIPEVLGKLKHLLKSEGKLLIIEATKESYALLTSLELKGGLDQFTDDRRDNDIIFNSKHSWEEKLKVSGFNVKFILPSDEDTIAENGQTIFFCTKGDNAFNITENYIKTFLKERLPEYMIPRNIRFMENIPLNVNNKIDRRLLLTMSQSIRETKMTLTNLEEKENLNQNEKIISSIWKEILGIEYVNKKDNFYSVGGDSLLIAQVVTKMRKSIKQLENISWDQLMREVLENPTLEGMSNIISQKEHSIQKMQKTSMSKYIHKYNETENAPVKVISFFHAGTGRLIDYKHMVENLLDKDMSDTQLIGFTYGEYQQYMETPVESLVQDRANLYAETLLEFNVDRYTLVGYCVGGFLALETAKILLENGKKVKLIMIDSRLCQHTISNQLLMEYAYGLSMELDMDNTPYSIKPVMLKEALEKILNGENRNIKNSELTKLSDEYAELGEVFTNLLDMTHEERIKALFNSKKQHNFNGEESTISMLNLLYDIYEHTFNAMMRYRPEGIYSGDITYINATEGIVNFYPDTNVATTWEDMVLGEFKIVNIYANHARACLKNILSCSF